MTCGRRAVPAVAGLVVVLVAAGGPATRCAVAGRCAAQDAASPPQTAAAAVTDTGAADDDGRVPPQFSLQLNELASRPRSFALFEAPAYAPWAEGSLDFGLAWPGAGRPSLEFPARWTLGATLGWEYGPDGRRRIIVFGKPKTWSDLDVWEKTGVVLQYSAAAASAAYFAGKLLKKLR